MVAIFCEAGSDGGRPTVFGTGEQTRDYVHVADVVAALLAAEARRRRRARSTSARGSRRRVLELVELVGTRFGRDDFEPEFAPAREGEVERTVLDTCLAAERLGWRAERTIETGFEQTLRPGPDPL